MNILEQNVAIILWPFYSNMEAEYQNQPVGQTDETELKFEKLDNSVSFIEMLGGSGRICE